MQPFVISHEHPDWFKPLFAELEKRGIKYETVNPAAHSFAIEGPKPNFDLFFNRMSPSAYLRDGVQGTFYTLNYLKFLEKVLLKKKSVISDYLLQQILMIIW